MGSIKPMRAIQLTLAVLSSMLAIAVMGTAAHTYHVYRTQRDAGNPWWLPLWPHIVTAGTKAMIGTSTAVVFLSIGYIIASHLPKLNLVNRPSMSSVTTICFSLPSVLLSVASIASTNMMEKNLDGSDSIGTWTCKFKMSMSSESTVAPAVSNNNFGTICRETKFDFWGMVAILALQTLLLALGVAQWFQSRSSRPLSEISAEKQDFGSK